MIHNPLFASHMVKLPVFSRTFSTRSHAERHAIRHAIQTSTKLFPRVLHLFVACELILESHKKLAQYLYSGPGHIGVFAHDLHDLNHPRNISFRPHKQRIPRHGL